MNRKNNNFYNTFSFFYPLVDVFLKPQKKKLFKEINAIPNGQLLEIGIGNGSHLKLYKTHKVTGIDTSFKMLEVASKKRMEGVKLLQMDGENLTFNNCAFDYVILSHVIAVVDNPQKLMEEVYRVLSPNGKLYILNHFTPDNWLKYVDRSFSVFSKIFHFKSIFKITSLVPINKFKLIKEISFGKLSYFKLLIYLKH